MPIGVLLLVIFLHLFLSPLRSFPSALRICDALGKALVLESTTLLRYVQPYSPSSSSPPQPGRVTARIVDVRNNGLLSIYLSIYDLTIYARIIDPTSCALQARQAPGPHQGR